MSVESAKRFLYLAMAGSQPGASSGEKICHKIAKALHEIGEDFSGIDGAALEGACHVVKKMAGPWQTAEEREHVFKCVAKAAGKEGRRSS